MYSGMKYINGGEKSHSTAMAWPSCNEFIQRWLYSNSRAILPPRTARIWKNQERIEKKGIKKE
jgi:hypothetical protein